MKKIGLIGAGVWGTGLALTAARAGCDVLMWAREEEVVQSVNLAHVNRVFMPDIPLPDCIRATGNMADVAEFSDVILLTVAAQFTRSVLEQFKPFVKKGTTLVLCAKGIEVSTGCLLSEIAKEVLPDVEVAVLSGPGFAHEVALQKPTAVTIACENESRATQLADMLGTKYFRPYTSTDIISPEIGGSVKNVMAIASGISEGAGFGDNARAALITRGLNEMIRLSRALGGHTRTMVGMCGLGDLVLTASCTQSRNFAFGFEVGRLGNAKALVANNTKTVEGIPTCPAVLKRAEAVGVEMPICETVKKVLFDGESIDTAMNDLLTRPFKDEGF